MGKFSAKIVSIKMIKNLADVPKDTPVPILSLTDAKAKEQIDATIRRGAVLWNRGYQSLCAALYRTTTRSLAAATGPSQTVADVSAAAIKTAAPMILTMTGSSLTSGSWVYRRAFDAILASIALEPLPSSGNYPAAAQGNWLSLAMGPQKIVQLAAETPALSTLVTAIKAADLVTALSGVGPFTVFAPTNDAFSKVNKWALQALLLPANKAQLTQLLQYHVVSGSVKSDALSDGQQVDTLLGSKVTVSIVGTAVKVGGATVVTADVMANNGVVHVIDSVLVPASLGPFLAEASARTCKCAGVTTSFGGSQCGDKKFNGKKFCYVQPGTCSDGAMLTRQYGVAATGMEWSYKVCEDATGASMVPAGEVMGEVEKVTKTTATANEEMVVTAEISLEGVTEEEIVSDQGKQEAIRTGFASAIDAPQRNVKISKVGSTSLIALTLRKLRSSSTPGTSTSRHLSSLSVFFEIALDDDSEAAANAVKAKLAATSSSKINAAIAAKADAMGVDMVGKSGVAMKMDDAKPLVGKSEMVSQLRPVMNKNEKEGSSSSKDMTLYITIGVVAFVCLVLGLFVASRCSRKKNQTHINNKDGVLGVSVLAMAVPDGEYANGEIPMAKLSNNNQPVKAEAVAHTLGKVGRTQM